MTQLNNNAFISSIIYRLPVKLHLLASIMSVIGGAMLLAITAQIYVNLPFTPVPITGQTFGVYMLALLWGRNKATASFLLYLVQGFLGLPVFAKGLALTFWGPTMGYIVGMLIAVFLIGSLVDRKFPKNFKTAFLCCLLGSGVIFSCGLMGLEPFVPEGQLLNFGFFPFIIGDFLKISCASMAWVAANHTSAKTVQ